MRKLKLRNVKELYDNEGQVLKPKMVRSLKGSSLIQGSAGETDEMRSVGTERGHVERRFPISKIDLKEEFRTHNVCATPCSCCSHSKQVVSPMGTKANNFSDACKGKDVSQVSSNDVDMLSPSLSCACNGKHDTSNERGKPPSACSSHDSFSENAENKAIVMASATFEDSGKKVEERHGFVKASIFHGDDFFLNQLRQQKESECFGDNTSCISGSDNANMMVCKLDGDTERKNTSSSLVSVNSFLVIETPVNDQPVSCCVPSSPLCKVENDLPRKTDKFTNESSQGIEVCSNKSDLSEISSLRVSFSGTSSFKREPSECYEEQVESSLIRVATSGCGGQINDVHDYAECLKPDTEMSDRIPEAEVVKRPIQKEDFGKSSAAIAESDIVKPSLQSQPVGHSKVLDAAEIEVKVCDICGDAGREDLLANCKNCSDGAEHIYCMRVKLDKIPKGDWLCEECILNEENGRHMEDKFEKVARISSQPSLNETMQNLGNSSALVQNNSLKLSNESSGVSSGKSKVKSSPSFSSKRPAGSLEATSATKRTVFESIKQSGFSGPSSKICLNSSLDDEKMKQTPEVTAPGSLSKSKSFKIMDSKVKAELSEGGVLKRKFARETADSNDKEVKVARMMKSMSFNNASSKHTNASDPKVVLCSDFSNVEDLKRLRHAKEQSSSEIDCTSKFHDPVIASTVSVSGVSTSTTEEKIANCGETALPLTCGFNCRDLVDVQHRVKSDNLSKPASFFNRDFQNEEQNGVFNDAGQHVVHSSEVAVTIRRNSSNTTLHSNNSSLEDLPSFASVAAIPSRSSVVPQINYAWKGQFDIQGCGRLPSSCDGIQAHVSNCASPKVLEVVHNLPQKILLEEVPRSNNWPKQFLEKHATEDNIALYFFASNIESYERDYKYLMDCMIKNDLSLKGNFEGVELLIFPSNLLPEKSQRWNKMLFLWGVYRGRRLNFSSEMRIPQKTTCACSKNKNCPDKNQDMSDFPMSVPQNLCSCVHYNERLSAPITSYSVHQGSESFTMLEQLASGRDAENSGPHLFSTEHKFVNFQKSPDCQQTSAYHAKNHLARDVPQTDSSKREERDSKGGQVVDVSFQAGRECNMHNRRVDEEPKHTRLKSCFRKVDEFNNSRDKKQLNGLAPSFAGKDHTFSKSHEMSISSTNSSSTSGTKGYKSIEQQIRINNGSDYLEPEVLNLELSLGVEKTSPDERAMAPFGTMESQTIQDRHSRPATIGKNDDNESSLPLSLSLALPEWHGLNTSLSL